MPVMRYNLVRYNDVLNGGNYSSLSVHHAVHHAVNYVVHHAVHHAVNYVVHHDMHYYVVVLHRMQY